MQPVKQTKLTTKATSNTVQLVVAILRWQSSSKIDHPHSPKIGILRTERQWNDGNLSSITTHRPSSHRITSHSLKWNGVKIRNSAHWRSRHRGVHQMAGMRRSHWVHSKRWNLSVRCRRSSKWGAVWQCVLRQRHRNCHRQIPFGRRCSRNSRRSGRASFGLSFDPQLEALRLCHLLLGRAVRLRSCRRLCPRLQALFRCSPHRRGWNVRYFLFSVGDPVNIKVVVGSGLFVLGVEQNYHVGVIVVIAVSLLEELLHAG